MQEFLGSLSRRRSSRAVGYGIPLAVVGAISAIRFVVSLDTAPFLLYMPAIFLVGVALGRGPAIAGLVVSTLFAALFFYRSPPFGGLSVSQVLALVQYAVIGAAMVLVCDALRRLLAQNEASLTSMRNLNATLSQNQATLAAAKEEAEAAREEAEAAKDAAEAANRAKSAFLANMSHELRTPLSAVIGYTEMMEDEVEDIGETALLGDLGKVKSNARHLLSLINDVLDLSKIEADRMDTFAEDVNVAALVEDAAGTVGTLVGKKGNSLVLDVAADVEAMRTDVVKLRQCLFNLLSNAAKFTENGRVTLQVRREVVDATAMVTFRISDTGIGMTPEQLAKLFQRFTQADETTTRKFGGTGLGLALTRAFGRLLGGEVSVDSVAGQGTTFSIILPAIHASPAKDEALPDAEPATEVVGDRDLVLVIDDDPDQRTLLTRFLHKEGFRVQVAGDGRKGLTLARRLRPRAILLDVMMPGVDGWSVLTDLKADPDRSATPVVMVTSLEQRNLADSLGAAEYMVKPVRWDRFRDVMGRLRSSSGGILVVDDSDDARAAVCSMLADDGWTVTEAVDGREGLARAGERRPDVVLLDLNMPVMDGFDFLAELRSIPGCAEVPVVVLTARSLTNDDRRRLRGASQVLNKGDIGTRALVERLHGLADRVTLTA